MRDPNTILGELAAKWSGTEDELSSLVWEILADVQDSYRLAMENSLLISENAAEEIKVTVDDYISNHYGD